MPDTYVDAILSEWTMWKQRLAGQGYRLQSIYLGGGTPSLLDPLQVGRVIEAMRSALPEAADDEITLEANPDSLDGERIRRFVEAGVNRLSVGVQSFSDRTLKTLGRLHEAAQAERVLREARQAGVQNLSLDLMYGLPGSGLDEEISSLRHAVELGPDHISWYNLTLAAGTPLARMASDGEVVMPDDDMVLETMQNGWALLEASGYEHYEISNFARPGYASRHNLAYWLSTEYVGLGLGASGFVSGRRWTNIDEMNDYNEAISQQRFPVAYEERLGGRSREGEYAMLRLRLPGSGLEFAAFTDMFHEDARVVFREELAWLAAEQLIVLSEDKAVCTQKGLELNNLVAEVLV